MFSIVLKTWEEHMISEQTFRVIPCGALRGILIALGLLSGCTTVNQGQKCSLADCSADARITSAVQSSLDRHPELGPSGQLHVATLNDVVYLYGSVANDLQLAVARSVASKASGDAKIVSSIAVTEK
jgi:osmotically-inducible protein OsmY